MTRPNVVLIVFDTARADAFEPWGAPAGSTPAVAQLADRGTAFPYAVAPANWTVPSHASMFTGLLPRQLGLTVAPGGRPSGCRPALEARADRFLPQVLRSNGYATAGVSTNMWVQPDVGFGIGFDDFRTIKPAREQPDHDGSARARMRWSLAASRARVDDGAAEVESLLDSWITSRHRDPFFWFVNLIECHSPYLPPRPYNDLNIVERYRAADDAARYLSLQSIVLACVGHTNVPVRALRRMHHLYRRSIRLMDDWLARLLESLERGRLLDDTIVIVTSDHGENFGEQGLIGHALSLDERLTHVPVVAAGPAVRPYEAPFSLASIPRLVADLVGIGDHPWCDSTLPDGVAVAQHDGVATADDPRVAGVAEELGISAEGVARMMMPMTSASDGHTKLVATPLGDDYYDLGADPGELTPQPTTAVAPDVSRRLRAAVDVALQAAPAPAPVGPVDTSDARHIEAQMRLLGYL